MEKLFLNGGCVRIYFDNAKLQRVLHHVYDVGQDGRFMRINCTDGMYYIANLNNVALVELAPNMKQDKQKEAPHHSGTKEEKTCR